MANPGTGDDDSSVSMETDRRSVTIQGWTLEPGDLILNLLAVGSTVFAAISTSTV